MTDIIATLEGPTEHDAHLCSQAHRIAAEHTKRRWFESDTSRMIRAIRLRTAIYAALLRAKEAKDGN